MRVLFTLVLCATFLSACSMVEVPEGIEPIENFEQERYLGKWYEIARLDHPFERGLEQVYAEYSLRNDGGINVINSGFKPEDGEWERAEGKAYFVNKETRGHLKVSFFGPFYASYVIFDIDRENYQWALVSGPDRNYLWLLSRTPKISEQLKSELVKKARKLNFNTEELIFVNHTQ